MSELKDELKLLIKPRADKYYSAMSKEEAMDLRDREVAWRERVVSTFKGSIEEIERADREECAIPRKAILSLAVAANQLKRNYWDFNGLGDWKERRDLLDRAVAICTRFKAKSLYTASDWKYWDNRPSTLEKKIDVASRMRGDVHCRRCGRLLTNNVSVVLGIGPICRKKPGWRTR